MPVLVRLPDGCWQIGHMALILGVDVSLPPFIEEGEEATPEIPESLSWELRTAAPGHTAP